MNLYLFAFIAVLLLCVVFAFFVVMARIITQKEIKHLEHISAILKDHRTERQDLIDRLMARDLKELKQAQVIEPVEPRAVSKHQNNARLVEEARKVAEGK